MKKSYAGLLAGLVLLLAACGTTPRRDAPPASSAAAPLKIASWNMEHLAETDGTGCKPRTEPDYAALRAYTATLDADVVVFQEVESQAAAERVFTPDRYVVVMSTRPDSGRHGPCRRGGDAGGLTIRRQSVGLAIRKGIAFARNPDLEALGVGNPDLRWGVDVTIARGEPVRLLGVHLKSGCARGDSGEACEVLFDQVPVLQHWIEARAAEGTAFAILGDWNRRLALAGDPVWKQLGEAMPAGRALTDAAGGRGATCKQRFPDYIDHIVLDPQAAARMQAGSFEEFAYGVPEAEHPSDHCPIAVRLD
ncbi:endonuclease/exonuclease/phosphatase family protein [Dokdonella sp. MW10]|uniref:endonuclease/exonuclease/phosphatase family protein n=1 Tax=Dokdonella sp. MW10 TaxID=2992926 RepID=UPI003F822D5B